MRFQLFEIIQLYDYTNLLVHKCVGTHYVSNQLLEYAIVQIGNSVSYELCNWSEWLRALSRKQSVHC